MTWNVQMEQQQQIPMPSTTAGGVFVFCLFFVICVVLYFVFRFIYYTNYEALL